MLVLPTKSASVWQKFLDENRVLVYKYIVRQIKRCIKEESDVAELFRFEDESMVSVVDCDEYLTTLDYAKKLFVEAEEFEAAAQAEKVIRLHHVHNLINESRKKRK